KGKLEPVRIFEPVGPADALDDGTRATLTQWEAVLAAYCHQQWDEADRLLASLRLGEERPLYRLYAERIAQFRAVPPPAGWDGVYTYTTK
ncbi:MAG: adenylyl cyclase class-3/4/guanylyl cyclase, partial [Moraxellaceae bacterium]|nr:adenylyl cyclase class-3/4/guanylyl cyclase [Moraxellaceae bacterium]